MQILLAILLSQLSMLPVARLLTSGSGHIRNELRLMSTKAHAGDVSLETTKPIIRASLEHDADEIIWEHVYTLTNEVL